MLGLSVDLRWFDGAWPNGLQALNKLLLVDMGLYGFLAIRQLNGVGFDFCFRWSDWKTGLRELIFFTPVVLTLGLALGFIHPHASRPHVGTAVLRWALSLFSPHCQKNFSFVAGYRIYWNPAWVAARRSPLPRCYSDCHISTSALRISIGDTYCWPPSRAFSMGARGANTGVWRPQPLHTPPSTGFGVSGSKAKNSTLSDQAY